MCNTKTPNFNFQNLYLDLVFYANEAIRVFAQYPCFDTSLPSVSIFHKKLFVSHFKKAQKDCNVVQTQFFLKNNKKIDFFKFLHCGGG